MKRFAFILTIAMVFLCSPAWARVIPHPTGCPHVRFCGCGASVNIFGHPIRNLFLARNWFKFPKTEPRHKAVAVRRSHVFVLDYQVRGTVWMAYDYNSGGHLSRHHEVDIRGWAIRLPVQTYAGL